MMSTPEREHERDEIREMKVKLRASAGKGASRDKARREPVTSIAKVESDRSRKNSRTKGSRAELDVAEMFSRWSGEVVRRTPLSGGWSSEKFGVTADLVCSNPAFPHHCEIKHREGWVLDDLVTGARKDHDKSIIQWWKQCVDSCPRESARQRDGVRRNAPFSKTPLLVFRRNRQPWLVMMPAHIVPYDKLKVEDGMLRFSLPLELPVRDVAVMRLDDFLDLVPLPEGLKNHRREP